MPSVHSSSSYCHAWYLHLASLAFWQAPTWEWMQWLTPWDGAGVCNGIFNNAASGAVEPHLGMGRGLLRWSRVCGGSGVPFWVYRLRDMSPAQASFEANRSRHAWGRLGPVALGLLPRAGSDRRLVPVCVPVRIKRGVAYNATFKTIFTTHDTTHAHHQIHSRHRIFQHTTRSTTMPRALSASPLFTGALGSA